MPLSFLHKQKSSLFLNSRSASASDMEDDSIDHVELDKSNVLLLGPTGSGLCALAIMFF